MLFAAHDLNWAAAHSDGTLALDAPPSEIMSEEVMRTLFAFEAETVASGGRTWIVPRVL